MIQRDFIVAWRQQAPWPTDAQVEQDLVLSRALVEIFRDPLLSRELAFRGGTALHKLFLPASARYSEDIDLVQISPGPIGPVMTALRGAERWGGRHCVLVYRYRSQRGELLCAARVFSGGERSVQGAEENAEGGDRRGGLGDAAQR
jgi:hypothetical protein